MERTTTNKPPAHANRYRVGLNLAKTPGKVILRNRLAELIQYQPTTPEVKPEPVLIIPAWIMKYYILDLSPHNSLIKHLVDQGYTVFCLSWKNPGLPERDLELDDYLQLGVFQALSVINKILPNQKVHATGYCLGGTLLAIAAAAMAREHDDRLKSITLFTTQTDFRESGELALFIDENEVSLLEAQMEETGYLSAGQMAGAFQMLRSNDLMWSRIIHEYLMGERAPVSDLMAWNADTTRMPARMHGRYLRELFLNNALSEGRYRVHGEPITLFNIQLPIFCVATTADHVAPWRSVYKLHYLTPAEITFVLTTGGHNAGIVNSPERTDRSYQILCRPAAGHYIGHQQWLQQAPQHAGSWWPAWIDWLNRNSGIAVSVPPLGLPGQNSQPLADAPGAYVFEN
jgi:polyhydroxyalkanoate synthase